MNVTDAELIDTKNFIQWYVNLVDKHKEHLFYYLAENAVLDWFGRTVKGAQKIKQFLSSERVVHLLETSVPAKGDIANKEMHKQVMPKTLNNNVPCVPSKVKDFEYRTPPNGVAIVPGSSRKEDLFAQGDGPHIPVENVNISGPQLGQGDCAFVPNFRQVESSGSVEFIRDSEKRGVSEIRWRRPCTLKIAYTVGSNSEDDYSIHLIIYENNSNCRKNLMSLFDSCEKD